MLATTGFLHRVSARQITSLARADPPGESIRRTMALTVGLPSASRMAATKVSDPTASPLDSGLAPPPPLPLSMPPTAYSTAIFGSLLSLAAFLPPSCPSRANGLEKSISWPFALP